MAIVIPADTVIFVATDAENIAVQELLLAAGYRWGDDKIKPLCEMQNSCSCNEICINPFYYAQTWGKKSADSVYLSYSRKSYYENRRINIMTAARFLEINTVAIKEYEENNCGIYF
jgi:hypothetical protein